MMPKHHFEAVIYLRLFCTSLIAIYKLFESLVCFLNGIWLHPYTIAAAKLPPEWGSQSHLRSENEATTSCLRLISTSDHFINQW
jgi:hypothetical protein